MQTTPKTLSLLTLVLLFAIPCPAFADRIIYVDADAVGANDGSSWPDALNYLQDALMIASSGDEIRVAGGVYRPDDFVLSARPNLGRAETFQLMNDVAIKGGYAGLGEPNPNARDIELYETILSGDLNGDDIVFGFTNNNENSYHVVTGSGTDTTAILDGFTVQAGNADGYDSTDKGGGMYNGPDSSPKLLNCTFSGNIAEIGGGVYFSSGEATVDNCVFVGNIAYAEDGGAIYIEGGTGLIVTNCTFAGNEADDFGASLYSAGGSPLLKNCILWNDAFDEIHIVEGELIVTYCNVQGGWPGEGNMAVDPCFVQLGYWDPGETDDRDDDFWVDGDYHLKSQAGRWDPNGGTWILDDVTSPCIDAGDPMSPIGAEPFPNGGIVNMGTYGGTAEASKSYFGKPPCETVVAGDINGDCEVGFLDFRLMALHWMEDNNL